MGRGSAGASCRGMGRGSARVRLRDMGRSSVGAKLRGIGKDSKGSSLRGMGSGGVQKNGFLISFSDICAMNLQSLADTSSLILGQWGNRLY